ncbi:MAG: class I SAM-dependent methyltransferase [Pseudomonadota bacterium]
MRKSLARIYDEFADSYEENRGIFDMTEVFDTFYRGFSIEKGSVLDLGCGAGEPFAAGFLAQGWSVTGVDFSQRMLEMAARYVPSMDAVHADMRDVEFGRDQFDAVTIIYALFHLSRADHAPMFEKIFGWLRPGGRMLFTYATQEYTGQVEFDGYKEFLGQELYYSHKSPDRLYTDLEDVGFEIEARDYRDIGGEEFLWVTVSKPD